jgi:hypothetical protein
MTDTSPAARAAEAAALVAAIARLKDCKAKEEDYHHESYTMAGLLEKAEAQLATAHAAGKAEGLRESVSILWGVRNNLRARSGSIFDTEIRAGVEKILALIPATTGGHND